MEFAPIVLFVYNRPDLTLNTLQCLSKNEEAKESTLYVYCDGAKAGASPEQLERIKQVREIVRSQPWCKQVVIRESEKNKGLATSVIDGVTEVIGQHGKIIVLEDDLTLSPFFLKYMNDALVKYAEEEKLMAVHGYLYPFEMPANYTDTTFLVHDPGSLGWGTWSRAWSKFEADTDKVMTEIKAKGLKRAFDLWGAYPFYRMLRQHKQGKVSSWAIRWRGTAYLHDMLTLYPVKSLVRHDGNGVAATHHSTAEDYLYTEVCQSPIPVGDIPVQNNLPMEKLFSKFLRAKAGMTIPAKIKNRLKKYWRKVTGGA